MKLLCVLCLPLALVAVSCGGDDDSGGGGGDGADVEAFCERLRELDTGETVDIDDDPEAAMAEMRSLRDAAPNEIRDDLDTVIEVFEQVAELEAAETDGEPDEDAFGEVFELIFDPDFVAASERLEQFGVDECGLEPSEGGIDTPDDTNVDDTSEDDTTGEGDDSDDAGSPDTAGLITEAADVPEPLFDPFFDDDVVDPNEISINGLQYHLDVNHPDAPWRTRLMSFSMGAGVGVGGTELDDVAAEVCDAVAAYVVQFEPDWEITIESYAQDDTGQYDYVGDLVTGTATDGC